MNRVVDKIELKKPKNSLLLRLAQVFVVVVLLSAVTIISSIIATNSLQGDAALINHSGALRMQAVRVSRAILADDEESILRNEQQAFVRKLQMIQSRLDKMEQPSLPIGEAYQSIANGWQQLVLAGKSSKTADYDQFVQNIDRFVVLLQKESEKKIIRLYWIQGLSLLLMVIIGLVLIHQIRRHLVWPVRELVNTAIKIGKGDFDANISYQQDNEIGLLASTIEKMKMELKMLYQDLESRVEQKTKALAQSNQSLQILYHASRDLALDTEYKLNNLESTLSAVLPEGEVRIFLPDEENSQNINDRRRQFVQLLEQDAQTIIPFDLAFKSKQVGSLYWCVPRNFVPDSWQIDLVKAFTDIVVARHELERRQQTEQRLLISEERAVIARELHDSLAQSLSYLKLKLGILHKLLDKNASKNDVDAVYEDMKEAMAKAYTQLRELLTTFRLKLDEPGFEASIRASVIEYQIKVDHVIQFEYAITNMALSSHQQIHLLHILREALSNIQRHAQSTEAGVVIRNNGRQTVEMIVWDNGVGIEAKSQSQLAHFGLNIIKERATALGATVHLSNREPKGTILHLMMGS